MGFFFFQNEFSVNNLLNLHKIPQINLGFTVLNTSESQTGEAVKCRKDIESEGEST